MMGLAHERQIVRIVVTGILIEVCDHQACLNLQAADHATPERVDACRYPPRGGLFSWQ